MATEIIRGTSVLPYVTSLNGGAPVAVYKATEYAALATKTVGIIYDTGAAPTPTGYPDGCIYLQHAA